MSWLNPLTNMFRKKDKVARKGRPPKEKSDLDEGEPAPGNPIQIMEVKDIAVETKGTWRFTEDQKLIVANLIGQGLTYTQVKQTCSEVHGFLPTAATLYTITHADKWNKIIMEARAKHFARMDLVEPSNKYVRVKRMDLIQERALKKGDLRSAISANEQIRKEFEKDSGDTNFIFQNNTLYQQYNTLSTEELLERQKRATATLKEKAANGSNRPPEENRVIES